VADIVPKERWGEALGMHGLSFSIGGALGPVIGSTIVHYFDINTMFYCSSMLAFFSIVIVLNMKETLATKQKFKGSMLKISRYDIIDFRAMPAAIVTFLTYVGYGVILTLIPDWSEHLGIQNKGLFFTAYTLSSIAIRFFSGKVSDKYGRIKVIVVGVILVSISIFIIGYQEGINGLLVGASIYGIGTGILSPALNAWTIDLSVPQFRGKAVATVYIALEAGIGLGALFSGYIYHDIISRIPQIMYGCSIIIALALIYMYYWHSKNKTNNINV